MLKIADMGAADILALEPKPVSRDSGRADGGFAAALKSEIGRDDSATANDSRPAPEKPGGQEARQATDGGGESRDAEASEPSTEPESAGKAEATPTESEVGDEPSDEHKAEAGAEQKAEDADTEADESGKILPLADQLLATDPEKARAVDGEPKADPHIRRLLDRLSERGKPSSGRMTAGTGTPTPEVPAGKASSGPAPEAEKAVGDKRLDQVIKLVLANGKAGQEAPARAARADTAPPAAQTNTPAVTGAGRDGSFAAVLNAAGSQAGAGGNGGSGAAAGTLPSFNVPVPMNQPGWGQAVGQRVMWMARNGAQEAQLQLNPRHLGPIEVRLTVNQEQVNVHFSAQHGATREALEQAIPRLRDMLGEGGLSLGQSSVSDQSSHGREENADAPGGTGFAGIGHQGDGEGEAGAIHQSVVSGPDDGVDYYA